MTCGRCVGLGVQYERPHEMAMPQRSEQVIPEVIDLLTPPRVRTLVRRNHKLVAEPAEQARQRLLRRVELHTSTVGGIGLPGCGPSLRQ